jgi:hypothetical protein
MTNVADSLSRLIFLYFAAFVRLRRAYLKDAAERITPS